MTMDETPARRPPTTFYGSRARNVARRLGSAIRPWGRRAIRLLGRVAALGLDILLPRPCLACSSPAERDLGLCPNCHRRLEPPPRHAGADPPDGCDAFLWLWAYRPPIDEVILGLKFRRLDYLGRHIAARAASAAGMELERAEFVVPMPMHWRRRLQRGRNHAESIARPLARRLDRPLLRALRRRTFGPPQMGRSRRQRLANRGVAFACSRPDRVRDRVVLLIDDVVTTGATAGRAARCLKAAGASEVILFVAARTLD